MSFLYIKLKYLLRFICYLKIDGHEADRTRTCDPQIVHLLESDALPTELQPRRAIKSKKLCEITQSVSDNQKLKNFFLISVGSRIQIDLY